jgi:hypothetical protein
MHNRHAFTLALFSNTSCAQRSVAMFDMVTPLLLLLLPSAAAAPGGWTMDTSWCVTTLQHKQTWAHMQQVMWLFVGKKQAAAADGVTIDTSWCVTTMQPLTAVASV